VVNDSIIFSFQYHQFQQLLPHVHCAVSVVADVAILTGVLAILFCLLKKVMKIKTNMNMKKTAFLSISKMARDKEPIGKPFIQIMKTTTGAKE
jgi:hypothetical protein